MSSESKFVPEIDDPVVRDLLPGYVNSRRLEIFQIRRLLDDNDFNKIRIIGHNLSGSGALYGLAPITDFGKQLENAALALNFQGVQDSINRLHAFLERLDI